MLKKRKKLSPDAEANSPVVDSVEPKADEVAAESETHSEHPQTESPTQAHSARLASLKSTLQGLPRRYWAYKKWTLPETVLLLLLLNLVVPVGASSLVGLLVKS